ncbi:MAG: DUF7146 domain-containing protein [Acidiphilium sp.]
MNDINFAALIEPVARHLLGEPNRELSTRSELRFGSHGSLAVVIGGRKPGVWHNHESGEGGGVLDLIRRETRRDDPVAWLKESGFLDGSHHPEPRPAPAPAPTRKDNENSLHVARQIWREAIDPAGTPVETYLASRALRLPENAPLRFHPQCPRGIERLPAMISLMTNPVSGEPCGVHRTFLRPDGGGKADGANKMMLGKAGIIRLVPNSDITLGLGIAEGIETALAVMQLAGWSPVWAACSAAGLAKFSVLDGVESLTIFADMDDNGAGLKAASECAARWRMAGREATISRPPSGNDWLDALNRRAA